jgi:hypothetical protein
MRSDHHSFPSLVKAAMLCGDQIVKAAMPCGDQMLIYTPKTVMIQPRLRLTPGVASELEFFHQEIHKR